MRRRVWCETLSYDELAHPEIAALLARYRVDLLLAVRPWQLALVSELVKRFQGQGVFVGLWPMIADEHGRWASSASCAAFIAFADRLVAAAPSADELVIDLEPPFHVLDQWKHRKPTWRQTPSPITYRASRDAYAAATRRWRAARRVTTAVLPTLPIELRGEWLQRLFGTPVTELEVDCHHVMAYSSLFEGWSHGLIDRRRAEWLLRRCAQLTRWRFGDRAGLCLGTVAPGAFGDEPSYRDVSELARDVAVCRAAGVEELALFDLGGVIRRSPGEAWLEALCA
ncbi:MAG: hypothetical protein AB7P03_06910 [Kofleriaceae bacterium]